MFDTDLTGLDADGSLSLAAELRAVSDRAEARILAVAAHFADLHAEPARRPDGRSLPGMERAVQIGGAGTPAVAEFAAAELGAQLETSSQAASRLMADALDLRHRLPRLWERIQAGEVKAWVGRRIAQATRTLSVEAAGYVDGRVTRWAHSVGWARLEAMVEAAVIAADPAGAEQQARAAEEAQGVWVNPSTEHGIKSIFIRTQAPNAIWFDATVDRIADGLAALGDTAPKDLRRARAVGVIAQPQQALDLFDNAARIDRGDPPAAPTPAGSSLPPATLYVHLNQDSFRRDADGVARFEGAGPITITQAMDFLSHCHVTVKPVIDLATCTPVDAYEVPAAMRERVRLRTPVDVFPYSSAMRRGLDLDHTVEYTPPDDGRPPGQTRPDNLAPMTRYHHRVKTHGNWQVRQPFDGVFIWRSPHGRIYVVDHTGTTKVPTAA